ncbi:MAG TPA: hypothetical protein VFC53_04330, partial [Dehalococcoidia bacterium]|nr:hypothetical protein [Dehalococcoidia bacterium]
MNRIALLAAGVVSMLAVVRPLPAAATTAADADVDDSGVVDTYDLHLVSRGLSGLGRQYDVNGDGFHDVDDVVAVAHFMKDTVDPPPFEPTPTMTPTAIPPTATPSATASATPADQPSATPTVTPTATATAEQPAATATAEQPTPAATSTAPAMPSPTPTAKGAPTPADAPAPSDTPTPTPVTGATSTPTPTPTATGTPTATDTPAPTPTSTPTAGSGTRDKLLQPFASDSPWNMPIGSGAQYVAANLPRTNVE